jgi:hypothetical protein
MDSDYRWTRVVKTTLIVVVTLIVVFLIVVAILALGVGHTTHSGIR